MHRDELAMPQQIPDLEYNPLALVSPILIVAVFSRFNNALQTFLATLRVDPWSDSLANLNFLSFSYFQTLQTRNKGHRPNPPSQNTKVASEKPDKLFQNPICRNMHHPHNNV